MSIDKVITSLSQAESKPVTVIVKKFSCKHLHKWRGGLESNGNLRG